MAEDILPLGARMLREEQAAELVVFDDRVQKLDDKITVLKDDAKSSEAFLKQVEVGIPPPGRDTRSFDPESMKVGNRSEKNLETVTLDVIAVAGDTRVSLQRLRAYRIALPAGTERVFRTRDFLKMVLDITTTDVPGAPFERFDPAIVAATTDQGVVFNTDVALDLEKLDFEKRTLGEDRHALVEKHRQKLAKLEGVS